jgi:hypothetical protein
MGTKYSTVAISGYNSSPPPDDGSTGSDNQITWSKHKTKIGDPIKTAVESINSQLVTALDKSARSISSSDSAVAGDHDKVIEIASTVSTSVVTLSLADAATMANVYIVTVVNRSAYNQTIGRATSADGINGVVTNVSIPSKAALAFAVNAGADGYNIVGRSNAYEEGEWTPVLTFETPGDLSVTYSTQRGTYTRNGRLVHLTFEIQTSAFTHTTASGNLNITGSPFTAMNSPAVIARGSVVFQGITKANYTSFIPSIVNNTAIIIVVASGSGQSTVVTASGDLPTGGTVVLQGHVTLQV